jgi:trimeric autotransporter adhesin
MGEPSSSVWIAAGALIVLLSLGCGDDPPPSQEPCGGAGVICRIAGTGVAAYNGDGKPADETAFYLPSAVDRGPDGLLYIMDFNNMRLRRIAGDGTVETVAGNGIHAIAVPDVLATDSPLENPVDFAFDADGSIVFVSIHDPRVFRLRTDGRIEVLAGSGLIGDFGDGGDALGAAFGEIWGVALGPAGEIYVSDRLAHRVRVIHPDGTIDTLAGDGTAGYSGDGAPATAAELHNPEGLFVDPTGAVLVADSGNHVIRRIDPSGDIDTIAGSGQMGFTGNGGPALMASFSRPTGITLHDGRLYIADTDNHCIRVVQPNGDVEALVGIGTPGLTGDGGSAEAAELFGPSRVHVEAGLLVVTDQRNSCVRSVEIGE